MLKMDILITDVLVLNIELLRFLQGTKLLKELILKVRKRQYNSSMHKFMKRAITLCTDELSETNVWMIKIKESNFSDKSFDFSFPIFYEIDYL